MLVVGVWVRCGCSKCVYEWYTWFRWFGSGRCGRFRGVSGRENWVWALPILWGHGECWTCVLVAVVWVV